MYNFKKEPGIKGKWCWTCNTRNRTNRIVPVQGALQYFARGVGQAGRYTLLSLHQERLAVAVVSRLQQRNLYRLGFVMATRCLTCLLPVEKQWNPKPRSESNDINSPAHIASSASRQRLVHHPIHIQCPKLVESLGNLAAKLL